MTTSTLPTRHGKPYTPNLIYNPNPYRYRNPNPNPYRYPNPNPITLTLTHTLTPTLTRTLTLTLTRAVAEINARNAEKLQELQSELDALGRNLTLDIDGSLP